VVRVHVAERDVVAVRDCDFEVDSRVALRLTDTTVDVDDGVGFGLHGDDIVDTYSADTLGMSVIECVSEGDSDDEGVSENCCIHEGVAEDEVEGDVVSNGKLELDAVDDTVDDGESKSERLTESAGVSDADIEVEVELELVADSALE